MATLALLAGCIGLLAGGWLTDALTRRFGLRLGRMIPMTWSKVIGAIWHASFLFLAGAFFLSGVAAYWIRADVKIEPAAEPAIAG